VLESRWGARAAGRVIVLAAALLLAAASAASSAQAATLRVCPSGCTFSQVAPAVEAAHEGDTIELAAGTYRGGFTIGKSVRLVGAGAGATVIRGGGPVITIGEEGAASEPTVAIRAVTITGGENHGGKAQLHELALGGGISIPYARDDRPGATVTVENAVITGNRAVPTHTEPFGPPCPGGPCPFAAAYGGGIYSAGTLTLRNSAVTDNQAAGLASDADGAGIYSDIGAGPLTLVHVVVSRNRAIASIPNGRFAEGGGIFLNKNAGALTILDSVVSENLASLTSTLPVSAGERRIDMNANSGGIHVSDGIPSARLQGTAITGNSVSADDLSGEPVAFDGGMLVGDTPLVMSRSTVNGNRVFGRYVTSVDQGPSGTALELDGGGTITRTRITGNLVVAISPSGPAAASGGLAVYTFTDHPRRVTVQDSEISGNRAEAVSDSGSAAVLAAGVFNNSLLTLRHVLVSRNTGVARAPTGVAQGAGIWNGVDLSGPPVELLLQHTRVTQNSLFGSAGIELQGGGLFTTSPATLQDSTIRENHPDNCHGMAC
jgi:hypothetical protein